MSRKEIKEIGASTVLWSLFGRAAMMKMATFAGASKKIKFYIFKLKQLKYREQLECENAMRLEQYSRALTLSGAKIVCEPPCNLLAQTAFL